MTKFIVDNVFTVAGKLPVYISGKVIDGDINTGDYLHAPLSPSPNLKAKITSIEYAEGKYDSFICLGLDCHSPDEQANWIDLDIAQGDTLAVSTDT